MARINIYLLKKRKITIVEHDRRWKRNETNRNDWCNELSACACCQRYAN